MPKVSVKRVLIEYTAGGKLWGVDLDPNTVNSIFFDGAEFIKAQSVIPVNDDIRHDFAQPLLPGLAAHGVLAENPPTAAPALAGDETGPEFWWHTNGCRWIHPKDSPT